MRKSPIRNVIVIVAIALSMTIAGPAAISGAAPRTSTTQTSTTGFVRVGTHQWAAAQPTTTGRTIVALEAFDGRLYSGYGDYGANTGPVTVAGFNPSDNTFVADHVQDTEAILNFRTIGTQLVAPSTDPRVGADYSAGTPRSDSDVVDASHVFDVATLTGTDRWLVGSQGVDAVAWRSLDGGTTWAEALRVAARDGAGDLARFYFAGVLNGRLYVQASDYYLGVHPTSLVFDGTSWTQGPALISEFELGSRPVTFAGKLWFHTRGHGQLASIKSFDGTFSNVVATGYDVKVADARLYTLGADGQVKRFDGRKWATYTSAPATARSITAMGGKVYVGTTTAEIWAK